MIALLDIDGTLLHGAPEAHAHALCLALAEVYGVSVGVDELRASGVAGRTDRHIARQVLAPHGVAEGDIAAGLEPWCRSAVAHYRRIADTHPDPVAVPDAGRALTRLASGGVAVALVTGNIRAIALDKLMRAGLGGWFAAAVGGFGDEACARADLVRLAVARASVPAAAAVVIGDTPHDVAAARDAGCPVVAVTTGPFPADALAAADRVVPTLDDAARIVVDGGPLLRASRVAVR